MDGSGTIFPEGEVDTMVPGTLRFEFNYTDAAGNAALEVNRTVEVRDTITENTLNGDAVVTHEAGSVYEDENATRTDAIDGEGAILATGECEVHPPPELSC